MNVAIVDQMGTVVTVIAVDDADEYNPGNGLSAVPDAADEAFAGCTWTEHGGFAPPPRPAPSPEEFAAMKASLKAAVVARANGFTAPVLSKYPEAERAGWDKREAEARAILAAEDKAAAIAETLIIKLAQAAGEDTTVTVARAEAIVAQAEEFAAISAAVEIMRDTALAAVEAVGDASDMPAALVALNNQASSLAVQHGLA